MVARCSSRRGLDERVIEDVNSDQANGNPTESNGGTHPADTKDSSGRFSKPTCADRLCHRMRSIHTGSFSARAGHGNKAWRRLRVRPDAPRWCAPHSASRAPGEWQSFDVVFRANMKNMALLRRHMEKRGLTRSTGLIIEGEAVRVR